MGVLNKIIRRKMRAYISQLLGLVLLLVVGVCFYITLFTIVLRYEETAEEYIEKYAYADATFYGVFDEKDIRKLSDTSGVKAAEGRIVQDLRKPEDERIFRAVSLTENINKLYFYEGRILQNKSEILILKRNADAMNYSIGDVINLGNNELTITGVVAAPEYIYMVQNERTLMAQQHRFGVIYVAAEFFESGNNYNEILIITDGEVDINAIAESVGAFRAVKQGEQINHNLYRGDLEELRSFAYIFPLVFAVLIAVVIYVMLTRAIQKDRKQIGVMKALGICDKKIIAIYLWQFCLTAALGGLLGCVAAMAVTNGIIAIMSSMFVVPALGFVVYPALWAGAVAVSVALCAAAGLIALVRILPLMPAEALRARVPGGGRRLLIERAGFLWKKLSFNTRYALKSSLRNKSRFFAVVLGMTGSCALLAFSLGFHDSIVETQSKFFNDFANYDVIININPAPLMLGHAAIGEADESSRALILHVEIRDEKYPLAIVENNFDFVKIPLEKLKTGVIIPEYFAEIWGVYEGDLLEINGYEAAVSAVAPQHLGLTLYTSFDYINSLTSEIPPVYNAIYARSANMPELIDFLNENNIEFATIDDDKTSFDSIMESMEVLILFMIACAVLLGFTVLYAVGLINLSAREYEYMFMGVMGYSRKSIIAAHIKEALLQLALALPVGFFGGFMLLEAIKGEFSSGNFVIVSRITPASNAVAAIAVVLVTAVMAAVTSRHIDKLDIIEGLKAQDDG